MEYIFGNVDLYGELVENLKTVGETHSELSGFNEVQREYNGSVIVDAFVVVKKYDTAEDAEGNCYDWYVIDKHSRHIDYTPKHDSVLASLLGTQTASSQAAEQARKVLQLYASGLSDEQAMEVAAVYPPYEVGKAYAIGDRFTYGVNAVGDPQLYKVNQAHTSAEEWVPGAAGTEALYGAIGVTADGYTEWAQPTGAHDAYNEGDIVSYNGKLYESLIDGNVYSPDAYPAGWKEVEA